MTIQTTNNNNNRDNFTDIKWTPLCTEYVDVVINTYDIWFKINATNMDTILQKAINTTGDT